MVTPKIYRSTVHLKTYVTDFQVCMIYFRKSLLEIQTEILGWANFMSNRYPPWAAYCTIIADRLVEIDKCPIVISEVMGEEL